MNAQPTEQQQNGSTPAPTIPPANLLDEVVKTTESILVTEKGLDYANFTGLWKLATMIFRSKMYPSGLDSVEAIALVIARGRSIGLDPFQAMESMGIVSGKVMIYGDAPLAICRQHPQWNENQFDEYFEHEGKRYDETPPIWKEDTKAVCVVARNGGKPKVTKFSVKDAMVAKLWGKAGPWTNYPQRLLMFRARGYGLRDTFGDALKGIKIRELHEDDELGAPTPTTSTSAAVVDLNQRIQEKAAAAPTPAPAEKVETAKKEKAAEPEKKPQTNGKEVGSAVLQSARKDVRDALISLGISDHDENSLMLRDASLKVDKYGSETWLGIEHIDNVTDVKYLLATAKNLKAMKTSQASPTPD